MWIFLSGNDGKPAVVLYDYQPGRKGEYVRSFLDGLKGLVHCDGYQAYGTLEDVVLLICLAHCRRKFFEAVPKGRRDSIRLLDTASDQDIADPSGQLIKDDFSCPGEKGVAFCNRLFYLERLYREMTPQARSEKRLEEETPVWEDFWDWIETLNPAGGSKLETAVNYAKNHRTELMNYLMDGRCEISNNRAEREAKAYVISRKNSLFHDTVKGAAATAVVMSIIETAKANQLNVYQYLYYLLLYMPDYKEESAGIEQLLPWSTFIRDHCSGKIDTETVRPHNKGKLPFD